MKSLLKSVTIISFVLALFSCKKDKTTNALLNQITGKWYWFQTSSLIVETPQSTNKNWQLAFNSNYTCIQTGNLLPAVQGIFEISGDSLYIQFSNNPAKQRFGYVKISQDTLLLHQQIIADGPAHFFSR